jgi:ATP-dependent RNA helicase RhlE
LRRFAVLPTVIDLARLEAAGARSHAKAFSMTSFSDLGLPTALVQAVAVANYTVPTPIQAQAIPPALAGGDVLGIAQTGTGKTAAFALPILTRLRTAPHAAPGAPRALILAPTRELAAQIGETFRTLGRRLGTRVAVVFGGVPKGRQARVLAAGIDVLVATPGRLLDLMGDRAVRLDRVEVLVLDEADHMLDLGFIVPIRRIVQHVPEQRQTMFFSATMPKEIAALADGMLRAPVRVAVAPVATTAEKVEQRVVFVEQSGKRRVLARLLAAEAGGRTLVFTRTKHGADRVVKHLGEDGIAAEAIHGNKSQGQRERALAAFRDGRTRVLVATDIAARGIDVAGIDHVINFDLPNVPESYVHRIGRTARAGAGGTAISLCDGSERPFLRDIERLIRARVPVMPAPAEPLAWAA